MTWSFLILYLSQVLEIHLKTSSHNRKKYVISEYLQISLTRLYTSSIGQDGRDQNPGASYTQGDVLSNLSQCIDTIRVSTFGECA